MESNESARNRTMDLMTDLLVPLLFGGGESFFSGLALMISGVVSERLND